MERTTVWSTNGLELRSALSLWSEAISSAFLKAHTQLRPSSHYFQAQLKSKKIGALAINQLQAQSYQVTCSTQDQLHDWLFINVHQAGQCHLQQYGRHLSIQPGQLSINLGSSPFIFDFDDGVAMTCVRLPLTGALSRSGLIYDFAARPLPQNAGSYLLKDYLASLLQHFDQLEPHQIELVNRCLLDLVMMTLEQNPAVKDHQTVQQMLYQRACSYIQEQCGDPSFNLEQLSQYLNVAPRTIQTLFQSQGTTFSATLMETRLLAADQLIMSRRYSQFSQVAYAVGFSDQSHFNKAYRRRFHMTPGERQHAFLA